MELPSKYVTWLLSPEQRATRERLNEVWMDWGIAVGDVCIGKESGELGYVVRVPTPNVVGSHRTSWAVIHPVHSGTFQTAYPHTRFIVREWQWAPKLDQLVRMVWELVEAGGFERLGAQAEGLTLEAYKGKGWGMWLVMRRGLVEYKERPILGWAKEPEIAAMTLLEWVWVEAAKRKEG